MNFSVRYPLNSKVGRIATAFLLIVTILLTIGSVIRAVEFDRRVDTGELVAHQATVERIEITGKKDNRHHEVWVRYTFQGREFEDVPLSWYSSDMEEGQPTTIYLSADAPDQPVNSLAKYFSLVFLITLICTLVCTFLAWRPKKQDGGDTRERVWHREWKL